MVDNIGFLWRRKKVCSFFRCCWLFHPRQRNQTHRFFPTYTIIVAARDFVIRKFIIYFVIFLCFPLSWFERLKTVIPLRSVESFRFISSFPLFGMELCVSSFIAAQPILSLYFAFHTLIHQHIRCLHFSGVATNSTSTKHTEKKVQFLCILNHFLWVCCVCLLGFLFYFTSFVLLLLRVVIVRVASVCVCVCAVERQTHMIACVCVSRESFVCSMRATHFISIRSVCATGSFLVCCVLLSFCRSHAFYNKRNIIDFCVKYVVFCCPVLVYIIKFVEISHWCVYWINAEWEFSELKLRFKWKFPVFGAKSSE